MSEKKLAGQVAWVSGAASGIGEATAVLLAEHGAAVAVVDLKKGDANRVVKQIKAAGGEAIAIACDVSREAEVKHSIQHTAKAFGGLHIMVNNAGIVSLKLVHESTQREWEKLMSVNVSSIFLSMKHAYRHLKKNARSYVVNVASISSFVGQAGTPAYTTSKHAVLGLTRSIALDYAADGVRCNCVCPGITDTPLLRKHLNKTPDPDATLANRLKRVCMGVPLSPRDIARSILYLSCEDSAGVTGTSLTIDCGYLTAAEWEHPGQTRFMEKIS